MATNIRTCSGMIALVCLSSVTMAAVDFDVVVYGSTPAGVAAATAAGFLGMKVALFEPLKMIGGMGAAGNLALNDGGNGALHTGLALNFTTMNAEWYGVSGQVSHPESFVANDTFYKMLAKANVDTIKLDCRLLSAKTDKSTGVSKVQSINVFCEEDPITATVFIDASYDGEIMVAAGDIDYTAGREAISKYNESYAGARTPGWSGVAPPKGVNALKDDGTILKYVANISQLTPPGEADDALMAFQHRMCISGDADRIPWPKPDNYNPDDFLIMQRALEADGNNSRFFSAMPPSQLPGYPGKKKKYCLCCGISIGASDQPMLNAGWANATWERKQEIIADHTYFELGTFYYFSHDPKVPQAVRDDFNKYGLCSDEFVDNNYIPHQLYIRISNRLVGDYVMTQNNIAAPLVKNDSIACGDWSFDEHMTGKYALPQPDGTHEVVLEGNFWPSVSHSGNKYDVPYKIMVPKRGTGANLLVPVCLSASAVAYSSTRIENMFMSVGSAAGVAAMQVVGGDVETVQDVDVSKVQSILTNTFHQDIHSDAPPPPTPPPPPAPQYFVVAGAGSSDWNGKYNKQGSSDNYALTTNPAHALYSNGGVWRLAIDGKELYYVAVSRSALPPLSAKAWTVANGSSPAPSLTAGPV